MMEHEVKSVLLKNVQQLSGQPRVALNLAPNDTYKFCWGFRSDFLSRR